MASSVAGGCAPEWTGSVGAVFAKDNRDGRVFVREVPSDMGAARAGLKVGDELVAVDGKAVRAMSPEDVHHALAGAVGSRVKLTVMRRGESMELVVERGPLQTGPR